MPSFDPTRVKLAGAWEHPGTLYSLCHDGGRRLFVAGSDASIYLLDPTAEKLAGEKKWTNHDNYVVGLAWLDGQVVSASYDGRLQWTKAETGESVRSVAAHAGWVRQLVAVPGARRLATVGDDMLVKVWDADSGAAIATFDGHARRTPEGYTTALYALAASPDGRFLASGDRIGAVCVWDVERRSRVAEFRAASFYTFDPQKRSRSIGGVRSLAFSADGMQLALSGIGQVTNVDGFVGPCRAEIWDWQAAKRTAELQDKHNAVLNHVAFLPESPWLVAAGGGDGGGVLAFWKAGPNAATPSATAHLAKPKGHIQRFVVAPENRLLTVGFGGVQAWTLSQ